MPKKLTRDQAIDILRIVNGPTTTEAFDPRWVELIMAIMPFIIEIIKAIAALFPPQEKTNA